MVLSVHRPNIFWGSTSGEDRYGLRSEYADYELVTNEVWRARILWSDDPYDANAILTKNSGTGAGLYTDAAQRVELTIPSDIPEGNLIIAVSSDTASDIILWSWAVWS